MENFDERLTSFVLGCEVKVRTYTAEQFPNIDPHTISITTERGKRYVRVVRVDSGGRSAHCFVDTTNGNVLKAAGWKAPAKHARGNIFNADNGLDCMTPYGTAYLR